MRQPLLNLTCGEMLLRAQGKDAFGAADMQGCSGLRFASGFAGAEEVNGGMFTELGGKVLDAAFVVAEALGGFFGGESFDVYGAQGFILSVVGVGGRGGRGQTYEI